MVADPVTIPSCSTTGQAKHECRGPPNAGTSQAQDTSLLRAKEVFEIHSDGEILEADAMDSRAGPD